MRTVSLCSSLLGPYLEYYMGFSVNPSSYRLDHPHLEPLEASPTRQNAPILEQ